MKRLRIHHLALVACAVLAFVYSSGPACAQYTVTPLVSNQAGKAKHTDTQLKNAWGIAFFSTGPIWVSDNGTGLSTIYNGQGVKQMPIVTIPPAPGNTTGSPSGIVANASSDFQITKNNQSGPAYFLFATMDGTISGWNPVVDPTHAVIAIDNSKQHAIYTGLAITRHGPGMNFLYAADNWNNRVDVYDSHFNLVASFTDPNIPANFAPFGVQDINGQVYVTFASTINGTGGVVDIFTEAGKLVRHFAKGAPLNQPWPVALAPASFGNFSKALLIGNNVPGGNILAYNLTTGKFLGMLKNKSGHVIAIDQLWGFQFGGGSSNNGPVNSLFFAAGPNNYANGLLGVIAP